jgi:UDP-GlcNAc3NAcA epimerase
MKIVTIVGARPQFVKAAMVSRAIRICNQKKSLKHITEVMVHTGQHYDHNMSEMFFEELGLPVPDYNLEIGSGSHGAMTGAMLLKIEEVLFKEHPEWVLVYGDTNSTLAGALAAVKLHIPVCHVEAGLRSFNKRMPEEINRILTDNVSSLLLCPTTTAVQHLANEGIRDNVHHVGDVMYDAAGIFGTLADRKSQIIPELSLEKNSYYLATLHRAENTDFRDRLESILRAFAEISSRRCPLIMPLHPRTRMYIEKYEFEDLIETESIKVIEPLSFLDMVMLEKYAKTILTDSGGVQKEAYFHSVSCVTLRDETEWVETINAGWNILAGACFDSICKSASRVFSGKPINEYGDGETAGRIVKLLINAGQVT